MFKTKKCNHGEKGMCINCLVNKEKQLQKQPKTEEVPQTIPCKHPSHMKCIRCLPPSQVKKSNLLTIQTFVNTPTTRNANTANGLSGIKNSANIWLIWT